MSDIPEEIIVKIGGYTEKCRQDFKRHGSFHPTEDVIFGYHLRDKEVDELTTWLNIKNEEAKELIKEINDLKIHNSFLNDENDGFRNVIKELEEQINCLKVIADDE